MSQKKKGIEEEKVYKLYLFISFSPSSPISLHLVECNVKYFPVTSLSIALGHRL